MADAVPNTNSPTADVLPTTTAASSTHRPPRKPRPNYNLIHRQPLPIKTSALPAFLPHHPFSLVRIAYALLSEYLALNPPTSHPTTHQGYYDPFTNSVHVTDPESIRALWEQGFFGKGSLSRSEPEWEKLRLERRAATEAAEKGANGMRGDTAAEVTRKRREERRRDKLERARVEADILEQQLRAEGKLAGEDGDAAGKKEKTNGDDAVQSDDSKPDEQTKTDGDTEKEAEKEALLAESIAGADSQIPLPQRDTHPNTSTTGADTIIPPTSSAKPHEPNQEHLQLTPSEAFFLTYALGILTIHSLPTPTIISTPSIPYTTPHLLSLFSQNTSFPPSNTSPGRRKFLTNYAIYHHYRSLGWTIRSGIKFGVDYLLYYRGPAFSHAEFAILIIPDYSGWSGEEKMRYLGESERREVDKGRDWWWLHAANRVQSQVRKTLVLAYVEVPAPMGEEEEGVDVGRALEGYRIREFVLKRWSPNRDRG